MSQAGKVARSFSLGQAERARSFPSMPLTRQCFIGTDVDEELLRVVIDAIGDANIVMSVDYPHADGPFPHGLETFLDLPGVGANLHDHPLSVVAYAAAQPVPRMYTRKPHIRLRSPGATEPDLQMIFVDAPLYPRWIAAPEHGYSIAFSAMTPRSRGSIRLAGADPTLAPLIDPNYLDDKYDIDRMMDGLQKAREVGEMSALEPWRAGEILPGPESDDEALHPDSYDTVDASLIGEIMGSGCFFARKFAAGSGVEQYRPHL